MTLAACFCCHTSERRGETLGLPKKKYFWVKEGRDEFLMCCEPGTLICPIFGLITSRLLEFTVKKKNKSEALCKLCVIQNILGFVMPCFKAEP